MMEISKDGYYNFTEKEVASNGKGYSKMVQ